MKKYEITLNEKQIEIVQRALDFYGRSFIGQLDLWHVPHKDGSYLDYDERRGIENIFKRALGIPTNGSWGIYQEHVSDDARISWDMVQVIRHQRWKDRGEKTQYTVDAYPAHQSGKEPLIEVNVNYAD